MKKLLNTLYVTQPDRYLSVDGENVVVLADNREIGRLPMHNLEAIVTFGYTGASPALMYACVARGIALTFMSINGKFLGRFVGKVAGNVVLRRQQYRLADDDVKSNEIAKSFVISKLYNSKWIIERMTRDYPLRINVERFKERSLSLSSSLRAVESCTSNDQLRGIEGVAAATYFSVFNEMILQQNNHFSFYGRTRRPPLDNVNEMLSFAYALLTSTCVYALETVGLDPYVGFMHTDRPGRASLALDLMEEFRAVMADRFVLTVINKKIIDEKGFIKQENGAVVMTDDAKKDFITSWQKKKQEEITHPFINEKVEWGIVPHIQAMLLARYIRGDLDAYPPFLWK